MQNNGRRPAAKVSKIFRIFGIGHPSFWPGFGPKPDQVFREIPHAGAAQAIPLRGAPERLHDRAALDHVGPKIGLQAVGGNVAVRARLDGRTNFSLPVLSLVRMPLKEIEDHLLAAVEAHAPTLPGRPPCSNGKHAPSAALHFAVPSC